MIVREGSRGQNYVRFGIVGLFRVNLGPMPTRPERASFPLGLSIGIPLLTPE